MKYHDANVKTGAKARNRLIQEFQTTKGLRQGCCVAPALFKFYLQVTLRSWIEEYGRMGLDSKDESIQDPTI
jgi:hypothetical protein